MFPWKQGPLFFCLRRTLSYTCQQQKQLLKTDLFSIDVNSLGKIVIRLFLFMGLLHAAFLGQYGIVTGVPNILVSLGHMEEELSWTTH